MLSKDSSLMEKNDSQGGIFSHWGGSLCLFSLYLETTPHKSVNNLRYVMIDLSFFVLEVMMYFASVEIPSIKSFSLGELGEGMTVLCSLCVLM